MTKTNSTDKRARTLAAKKRRALRYQLWGDKRRAKNAAAAFELRSRLGLTQEGLRDALALRCRFVSVRTIQGWEQGRPIGRKNKEALNSISR